MTPRISTPDTDPDIDLEPTTPDYDGFPTIRPLLRYRSDPVYVIEKTGYENGQMYYAGEFYYWGLDEDVTPVGPFTSERLARLNAEADREYEWIGLSAWRVFLRYWRRRIATFFGFPVQYVNRFPTR